jgi:hypothetical protein
VTYALPCVAEGSVVEIITGGGAPRFAASAGSETNVDIDRAKTTT